MTILAALIGFLISLRRATPPPLSVLPSMIAASVSISPTRLSVEPLPAFEHWVVFHHNNRSLHRIEGRAFFRHDAEAAISRDPYSTQSLLVKLRRPVTSSSMNYDYNLGRSHVRAGALMHWI